MIADLIILIKANPITMGVLIASLLMIVVGFAGMAWSAFHE